MGLHLTLTAASVSLDSVVAGASVGADGGKNKQRTILAVMAAVTFLCLAFAMLGPFLGRAFGGGAAKAGGFLLVAAAFAGLSPQKKTPVFVRKRGDLTYLKAVAIGLGIGVDGALASLSLAVSGYGLTGAAAVILFHYIFIELGAALSQKAKILRGSAVPRLLLFALGASKILL